MAQYSYDELKKLWVKAGGSKETAGMAAAIAMAESGGNPNATPTNPNGTMDHGLWQINKPGRTPGMLDPLANAKQAVKMSDNGKDWSPWSTAFSDARGGGASYSKSSSMYMAKGSPYQKFLKSGDKGEIGSPASKPKTSAGGAAGKTGTGSNWLGRAGKKAGEGAKAAADDPAGTFFEKYKPIIIATAVVGGVYLVAKR